MLRNRRLWMGLACLLAASPLLWRLVNQEAPWQTLEPLHAGRETVVTIRSIPNPDDTRPIERLSLWVTGRVYGEAELKVGDWPPQRLAGEVDWKIEREWSEPFCRINYEPVGAATGQLQIRYRFE